MVPVVKPYEPNRKKLFGYIDSILDSGFYTNGGPLVQKLEERLAEYLDVPHLLLVANGTLALQISFKALALEGEVVTTPYSFVATTSALVWDNLEPVYCDIGDSTFTLDSTGLDKCITARSSAILGVHVYGIPCDMEALADGAERHGLRLIYDGAHAFATKYNGHSILNCGDITTLSFHATKLFHTVEGGAIVTGDRALYGRAKRMINFGIVAPDQIAEVGINAKMSEFHAAVGLCVLDDIDMIIDTRRHISSIYDAELSTDIRIGVGSDGIGPGFVSYYPVLFRDQAERDDVNTALRAQGFSARVYFSPSLDLLPYVQSPPMRHSQDISSRVLCLPFFTGLPHETVRQICATVNNVLSSGHGIY